MDSTDIVPNKYVGAWQRLSQSGVDGTVPRSFWLQTRRLHASLTIPAHRPDFSAKTSLSEFNHDELLQLANQQGIAGSCIVSGETLHRRRQIDYQPSRGRPNIRHMRFEQDILLEEIPNSTERLMWRRLTDPNAESIALRFQDEVDVTDIAGQRKGVLLVAGDYFLYVRDRGNFVPQSDSLSALIECREYAHPQLVALLDFEMSFGKRSSGELPWEIQLSTLPFREGKPLFAEGGFEALLKNGRTTLQKYRRGDKIVLRRWSVDDWRSPGSEQET